MFLLVVFFIFLSILIPSNGKQVLVCGHTKLTISCPNGSKIDIVSADFGRKQRNICPQIHIIFSYRTDCVSPRAREILSTECNGKRSCEIRAKEEVFGDPCYGTYKYVDLDYRCVWPIESAVTCDGKFLYLSCPVPTQTLNIINATFGNIKKNVCQSQYNTDSDCIAPNTTKIVKQRCQNQEDCNLPAIGQVYGDARVCKNKYLEVYYSCVETLPLYYEDIACDGQILKLSCESGLIEVIEAMYGRNDRTTCALANAYIENINCFDPTAFRRISELCNHKSSCEIKHSAETDPCFLTYKFYKVKYKCISSGDIAT